MGSDHTGLLLDWGGVMTTNLFAAFGAFCTTEGVAPDMLREAFRHDKETRNALIAFEEGRMNDDLFASHLAKALGLPHERAEGLIDRMMAGATVEPDMVEMVRHARAAGIRVAMVSNSWGELRYPAELVAELFEATVISGREASASPTRACTRSAPSAWACRRRPA